MSDLPPAEREAALSGPVADGFLARMLQQEDARLAPWATRTADSRGRARVEDDCRLRTPFQRDRDRIVHSKAFRRLKHKTQVFIAPEGDHFRTRLTHTLEVTGIARAVARALGLNEDLTEAIALGHDLGHPPFGHTGERPCRTRWKSTSAGGSTTTSTRCASSSTWSVVDEVSI